MAFGELTKQLAQQALGNSVMDVLDPPAKTAAAPPGGSGKNRNKSSCISLLNQ